MTPSLLLTNGHVVDPANDIDEKMDILVEDGVIQKIGKKLTAPEGVKIIDATNKLVTPGLIDIQVHFREPGFEEKETIETGLRAALKGGFTTVVTMPNTNPITDTPEVVKLQLQRAKKANLGKLLVAAAITKGEEGDELTDFAALQQAGAIAVTDDGRDVQDAAVMKEAMERCKKINLPMMCHSEIEDISGDGVMHEGDISKKLGLPGIPAEAEDLAVLRNLVLAEMTGVQLHILHVSTLMAVDFIEFFQKHGVRVTAETCPQYFCLTDEVADGGNTYAKMYPPIRSAEHREAMRKGLQNGVISVITTDHAPHARVEKECSFLEAAKGSVGLETSFALSYTHLVKENVLSLKELIRKMTVNPSKVIHAKNGTLREGSAADISIFDLEKKWTVRVDKMETKGGNSVFEGMEVWGKAEGVMVDGVMKVWDGEIL